MLLTLGLLSLLAAAPAPAVEIEVFVPLCDNTLIACGRPASGCRAAVLEALASSAARHGPTAAADHRTALVDAYARYQRTTPRAASSVFSRLPEKATPPLKTRLDWFR